MQLSVFALRDLIHGVSRTRHFKRGLHVLRGSHAAFPRRVWAAGSFQCRLFVPPRCASSLMALLCIHLRLQRHKCMFYLCHPLCMLFFFSAAPSVRVAPIGKPILPSHTPVPRACPGCSFLPMARVSWSFSLSGWKILAAVSSYAVISSVTGLARSVGKIHNPVSGSYHAPIP